MFLVLSLRVRVSVRVRYVVMEFMEVEKQLPHVGLSTDHHPVAVVQVSNRKIEMDALHLKLQVRDRSRTLGTVFVVVSLLLSLAPYTTIISLLESIDTHVHLYTYPLGVSTSLFTEPPI